MINVCFITDENYVLPTLVAIQSLIVNSKHKACINIVASQLSEDSKNLFKQLATIKCKINIVISSNPGDNIDTKHLYVSKAAMLKFALPQIFSDLKKILYIDSDVLILDDLYELYHTDLENNYIAAIDDINITNSHMHYKQEGLKRYFNSGVMLLNLKEMRQDNCTAKFVEYKKNEKFHYFMDQDCFNFCLREKVKYLSVKYNFLNDCYNFSNLIAFYNIQADEIISIIKHPVIKHFAGEVKVWKDINCPDFKIWYSYFKMLPTSKFKNKQNSIYKKQIKSKIKTILSSFFKSLFYSRNETKKKYRFFGIPLFSIKKNNNKRTIKFLGIKFTYKKKIMPISQPYHDMVDDYIKIFSDSNYSVARINNKIKIWNDNITIEGNADNTLWTGASVFCNDEYHFDMNEKYVMFDIGLNLGMTSLSKAQDKNCVKIYGFEPFVPTFKLAQHNMKLNKKLSQKITIFNYGLGNKNEILNINYNPDKPGAMSSVKNIFTECSNIEKIHIKKTSEVLGPLFTKHKEKIFLKIDCEGAEKQILPDLDASGLIKKVDVIVMEWHFEDPKWIIDLLTRNDFIVFRHNVITNEIGMIRAYRKK